MWSMLEFFQKVRLNQAGAKSPPSLANIPLVRQFIRKDLVKFLIVVGMVCDGIYMVRIQLLLVILCQ